MSNQESVYRVVSIKIPIPQENMDKYLKEVEDFGELISDSERYSLLEKYGAYITEDSLKGWIQAEYEIIPVDITIFPDELSHISESDKLFARAGFWLMKSYPFTMTEG